MLRLLTAGESHGLKMTAILEGMPAGFTVKLENINKELKARNNIAGRGPRAAIEEDSIIITAGLHKGKTTGAPISLELKNHCREIKGKNLECPRPGHADLAGFTKYDLVDLEIVRERASARDTAMRVAVGALCKDILEQFDIHFVSQTTSVGRLLCSTKDCNGQIEKYLSEIEKKGDSVGGKIKLSIVNVPVGLGSYVHYDRRLDAKLAAALISIPSVKGISFGNVATRELLGSTFHDQIFYKKKTGFYRKTNNGGGIEGGMSNGMPIEIHAIVKPLPTLNIPLKSVHIKHKNKMQACIHRRDITSVFAINVIAESVASFVILQEFFEKFGGDSAKVIQKSFNIYKNTMKGDI